MADEISDVVFVGESRKGKRARVEPIPESDWTLTADRMADRIADRMEYGLAGRIGARVAARVNQQVAVSLSTECLDCEGKDERILELERLLAEKSTAYDELYDSTMCSICVNTKPNRILACGHVFCSNCIEQFRIIDRFTVQPKIHCPNCRRVTFKANIRRVFL